MIAVARAYSQSHDGGAVAGRCGAAGGQRITDSAGAGVGDTTGEKLIEIYELP